MLAALSKDSPDVEIKLEALGSADSMLRLRTGTLDIGIVGSPQPPVAEVQVRRWRNDLMMALLPASSNAAKRVTPEWLAGRQWASFAPDMQMHGLIASWFGQAGLNPGHP